MSTEPSTVSTSEDKSSSSNNNNNLPEYLLKQFDRIAKEKGYENYEIEQDAGSKHGDGFMATMLNIVLVGERKTDNADELKQDRTTLIVKLLPSNEARRELFNAVEVFGREVYMYNKILPLFAKLQRDKGLTKENGFFDYPNCYFAVSNVELDQFAIIMDDIRLDGFVLWDKLQPIGNKQVKFLMTALGRWHGLSFVLRDQQPEEFKELQELKDVMLPMLSLPSMEGLMNGSMDKFISMFVESDPPVANRLSSLKATWRQDFEKNLKLNVAEPFAVVGHGDCWNNNMMFRNNKEGNPEEICLLDWQLSRLGSVVLDLSYFLFSSTTKELRDENLDDLLQLYYSELSETILTCGSDADSLFSWDDFQGELKKFGNYGVLMAPMLLQIIVNKPENIPEMDTYAENVESNPEMANFDDESEKRFKKRVKDVYEDAERYGWI